MERIERRMKNKDDKIIFNHQKKDLKSLKVILYQLKKEHEEVKKDLNTTHYLLDLVDKLAVEHFTDSSTKPDKKKHQVQGLEKIGKMFEQFYLKAEKLSPHDKKFIATEKEKFVEEKENLERQLQHLDILIAKTEVFLSDIRNHLCSELTKGHDLVAVGQKLRSEFGKKVTASFYSTGRTNIIHFLENAFSLNRIKSELLFDLLEDGKIIKYHVNVSYHESLNYNFDKEGIDFLPVEAIWEINP